MMNTLTARPIATAQTTIASNVMTASTSVDDSLLDSFIDYLDVKPKTIETYSKALRQFGKYLALNGITQPTRKDIIAFRDAIDKDHEPTTVQCYLIAVKQLFKWTESEGIYPNVAKNVKGKEISREHEKRPLTSRQAEELLQSIDRDTEQGKRDFAIVSLMMTSGLRTVEVTRAQIKDLDTLGDETILYVHGKGRDDKREYVKVFPEVEKAIRASLATRQNAKNDDPLFISLSNRANGKPLTTRSVSRIVKNHLNSIGLTSDKVTAHSLRHTAVTFALMEKEGLREVQRFARHKNIATTLIYDHSLKNQENTCVNTVGSLIFKNITV